MNHTPRSLTCVGYSHGAALALLATEELSHRAPSGIEVKGYGFASPRVIWGTLPDTVCQHLRNFCTIRNISDLVTHLPPVVFGFRHIHLQTIGEKGKYGPIEAHTPLAYTRELRQASNPSHKAPSTCSAVALTNATKSSSDRWVFRSTYSATPRR